MKHDRFGSSSDIADPFAGYDTLPADACPICAYTPMEKDKCSVSTSLRTTIAVFLRHAEKRHKDALAKEAKEMESQRTTHVHASVTGSFLEGQGAQTESSNLVCAKSDDVE